MPRKDRYAEPGIYHIINRGTERRDVFLEYDDYDFFLNLLFNSKKLFNTTIHCFCLMTNHYHLLIETKEHNLSKIMQYINDKYAKYFNKKYTRVGHLWQGRFKSYPLFDDAHFWIVAKYIERNPIKANMIEDMSTYKFQSFFQWSYDYIYKNILDDSKIYDMTLVEYEDYISTDLDADAIDIVYVSPKLKVTKNSIVLLTKRLETFFEFDKDINRNDNIKKAYGYGYTKSEIANFLNLNHSSISRIVKI